MRDWNELILWLIFFLQEWILLITCSGSTPSKWATGTESNEEELSRSKRKTKDGEPTGLDSSTKDVCHHMSDIFLKDWNMISAIGLAFVTLTYQKRLLLRWDKIWKFEWLKTSRKIKEEEGSTITKANSLKSTSKDRAGIEWWRTLSKEFWMHFRAKIESENSALLSQKLNSSVDIKNTDNKVKPPSYQNIKNILIISCSPVLTFFCFT